MLIKYGLWNQNFIIFVSFKFYQSYVSLNPSFKSVDKFFTA